MTVFGAFLQSLTNNIYIFFIGIGIAETAVYFVGIAYMSWIAPHNIVTKYTVCQYFL